MAHEFTDSNFQNEVLNSPDVVLVDFWAPWCGPCQRLVPIVEELAEEMKGQPIKIGKVNVDENQVTPGQFGIMSIPTIIFFKAGQPIEQLAGLRSKEELAEKIKAHTS